MRNHALERKRILVTGGAGYLATNLLWLLRDTACHIVRVDRPGARFEVPSGCECTLEDVEVDVTDRGVWGRLLCGVDVVFHFAAQTSVYVAERDPAKDLTINVMPMLAMLEACRSDGHRPIVLFSGTVTEAGLTECLPVGEECPDRPITVYDLHKWMAENYLKHFTRAGVVKGTTLRLANVYGPGPKSSSADRGVLNMMIRKALHGQELTVYGEGEFLRDYVHVQDVARAFLHAAAHIDKIAGGHFVIGSGEGNTIRQAITLVADRVGRRTGVRPPVVHVETPPSLSPIEFRNFIADTARFAEASGWRARWSLADGIDATIEEFLARE